MLRVVRATHYQNDSRWNFLTNLYPFNTLYLVLGGDGFVRVGKRVTPLLPDHAYLIPANTLFSCWCQTHIDKVYIEFHVNILAGLDVFSGLNDVQERPFPAACTRSLISRFESESLRDRLSFQGELLSALASFAQDAPSAQVRDTERFRPILDDIAGNLRSDLRLQEVAARHGMNPYTLSRSFKRAFGCGFKQYVERLLVNAIKQELLLTDKRLSELASEYHFCDAYYLSAFFKRHMTVAPEVYRKLFADGDPEPPDDPIP